MSFDEVLDLTSDVFSFYSIFACFPLLLYVRKPALVQGRRQQQQRQLQRQHQRQPRQRQEQTTTACSLYHIYRRQILFNSNSELLRRLKVHAILKEFGWQLWDRKTENKIGFPSSYWSPRAVPSAVMGHFGSLPTQEKNLPFSHSTSPLQRVLASQGTDHDNTWRLVAPLCWSSSPPSLRAVGGLCLEVSLGTWEPRPFLFFSFRSETTSCSVSQKVGTELGQACTSQARPRDTHHLLVRALNLAARTLRSVEHTPSKFLSWPAPSEARTRGCSQVLCAKSTIFCRPTRLGTEQEKPAPCVGFNTTKAKACFVLCFPVPQLRLVWVSTPQRRKPVLCSVFRSHHCRPSGVGHQNTLYFRDFSSIKP